MSSAHSRRRFRDIAALVDLTENESEFTASTSLVQRTIQKEKNIDTIQESDYNFPSFGDQLKNQANRIQQYVQEKQQQLQQSEPSEEGPSTPQPYLSAFLLKQRLHINSPASGYADSNAALNGEEKHEEAKSQTYSSAELSMEAAAGNIWGGSTAQRFNSSSKRVQSGSLWFQNRLRSRFGGPSEEEPPSHAPNKVPRPPKRLDDDDCMEQPIELVLNATESTDSCTLSYSTTNHSTDEHHHRSPGRMTNLSYELPSPERPMDEPPSFRLDESAIEAPADESTSFRIEEESSSSTDEPEAIPSWQPQPQPHDKMEDEESIPSTIEPEVIPLWKLKQRQMMRARMEEPDSPSTEVPPRTPARTKSEDSMDDTLEAAPALVTPPPPPSVTHQHAQKSWKAKQFRRTFRHRAALRRVNAPGEAPAEPEPEKPSEVQNVRAGLRRVRVLGEALAEEQEPAMGSFPQSEQGAPSEVDSEATPQDPPVPPSPVSRLRNLFETPDRSKTKVGPNGTPKFYMNDPTTHQQRRKNHRVISNLRSSLSKDPEEDEDESVASHPVVAYPPSHDRSLSLAMELAEEEEDENDETEEAEDSQSAAPLEPSTEPSKPASWWTVMKGQVDRYHISVMGKTSSGAHDEDLRKTLEEFAEGQNQLGRAMAVALFRGMELGRPQRDEDREAAHARELQELREKHEAEMRELRQQLLFNNRSTPTRTGGGSVANAANRNEAFRQRWKDRMNSKAATSNNDTATEIASTVVSNMSCRELSVERYRARILQQMNRGKKAPSLVAASVSTLNLDDDRASEASTSASEIRKDKKNAKEIQRLLDELQTAERRQKLLEKQLQQAGVVLAEDIPYQLAKDKVAAISQRMNEIGSSDVVHEDPLIQKQLREEYFRLEKDMEKYMTALLLTDEFAEEQRLKEEAWESKNAAANRKALEDVRRHMPVEIRSLSPKQLEEECGLAKAMVQKFRRTNVLQLLRVDPAVVTKWHPSTLEAFRVTGLTLTERRALHCYLEPVAASWKGSSNQTTGGNNDPMTSRKIAWYTTMRTNFKEALTRYEQHLGGTDGRPRRHIHSTCLQNRCDLKGNQCPVRANKALDYLGGDGGFPSGDVYEAPRVLVGLDQQQSQQSPAEIIAAARGKPTPVITAPAVAPKPKIASTPPVIRPVHPMMKGPSKPNGLLAAIAARRID